MIHFMKVELRKGHMKQYIQASFIASIVPLVFIYFIAFAAKIEREPGFQQYTNIYLLTSTVWMIFFYHHSYAVLACRQDCLSGTHIQFSEIPFSYDMDGVPFNVCDDV